MRDVASCLSERDRHAHRPFSKLRSYPRRSVLGTIRRRNSEDTADAGAKRRFLRESEERTLIAEIIAIGSELTTGAKLDTNSQWLSWQLAEIGIAVQYHTTVADDLQANIDVLRIAVGRVDVILLTGGLGPTLDDLTRHAIAGLLDGELYEDETSMQHLESFFASRGREMPDRNRIQAMFPIGSTPLVNPVGTAPGIWCEVPRPGKSHCLLAAMPGVPSEMHKMYREQVKPRLPGGELIIRRARINCFGIGESATEELLGELTARGSDPEVGITAHEATITLRINAHGASDDECRQKIERVDREIRHKLGEHVFGVEDEEIEDCVVQMLIAQGKSFSTYEQATAGLLAQKIAHVPQADECYRGGWVAMHCETDVRRAADLCREQSQADYVIVIGPEAVRTEASGRLISEIPIVLMGEHGVQEELLTWSGNPAITRSRTAKCGLNMLRMELLQRS